MKRKDGFFSVLFYFIVCERSEEDFQ